MDGRPLDVLSTDDAKYFAAQFFLVPPTGTIYKNPSSRSSASGSSARASTRTSRAEPRAEPAELELRLEAGADFADLFEVKDALAKKGETTPRCAATARARLPPRRLRARDARSARAPRPSCPRTGCASASAIEPKAEWSTCLFVVPVAEHGVRPQVRPRRGRARSRTSARASRSGSRPRRTLAPAGTRSSTSTGRASSTWPRCASSRRLLPGRLRAGRRPAVVHGAVRPRQPDHELPGAPVRARARRDDPARARREAGADGRRLPRRGAGQDPARAPLRRADRLRRAAALALLRHGRRDAAVPRPARRDRALDGRRRARPRAGAAPRAPRSPGSTSTATATATATSSTSAQHRDRAREPVLEGLLELDPVRGRLALRAAAGDLRDPGLRLRREGALRRGSPARSGATRCWPERLEREAAELKEPLQPRLLAPGARLLRARAGRREAAGRLPDLEHRPPALERDRRRRQGRGASSST